MTSQGVGHDDFAWESPDEVRLLMLSASKDFGPLFSDPSSAAFSALMLKHFGSAVTPAECVAKLSNLKKGLKTSDHCKTSAVFVHAYIPACLTFCLLYTSPSPRD